MEKNEAKMITELSKKYCKSERFIILLVKICKENNINNIKEYLEKELKGVSKGVSSTSKQTART